ncbi:uncharacterized protein BO95DRAFT_469563 [Aspergillus brunneoviolaceus CBS 621.78]|uniref:Uncharacterized protein n=1 Tax=Aspergillus brunneoviolaceus CBS 621.78 TaxID=1450534 RepID=A0ACD1FRM4_9EURO|nr:hypothetical protein BO95DRAFT_469563 [Aspergillus brunneoviolaceus CBS 621.78]RAH39621.1 hypothetical protein BO95DRAFT_469563 [Aspergillus brunneoviolaceus CBS 621.78]
MLMQRARSISSTTANPALGLGLLLWSVIQYNTTVLVVDILRPDGPATVQDLSNYQTSFLLQKQQTGLWVLWYLLLSMCCITLASEYEFLYELKLDEEQNQSNACFLRPMPTLSSIYTQSPVFPDILFCRASNKEAAQSASPSQMLMVGMVVSQDAVALRKERQGVSSILLTVEQWCLDPHRLRSLVILGVSAEMTGARGQPESIFTVEAHADELADQSPNQATSAKEPSTMSSQLLSNPAVDIEREQRPAVSLSTVEGIDRPDPRPNSIT